MRTVGQFIGVLLLIGFVGACFWWIIAIAAVALLPAASNRFYAAADTSSRLLT
jgi:hypothetical protein